MSLSLSKLETFLLSKGYIPSAIFTQDNYCFLIEATSKSAAGTFMIYIPSKYNIAVDKSSSQNVFELTFKDISAVKEEDEEDDCVEGTDEVYFQIEDTNDSIGNEDLLENSYKRTLQDGNLKTRKKKQIIDIYKQLKRLRFCVQASRFKLAISTSNIIGVIRRDDSVEVYEAIGLYRENSLRLYVVTTLDMLYETHKSNLDNDIALLHRGVYNVIEKSRQALIIRFSKILSSISSTMEKVELVYDRKTKYDYYSNFFGSAIDALDAAEIRNTQALAKISVGKADTSFRAIQEDMSSAHLKNKLEDERELIYSTKKDIYDVSNSVHTEMDNFILSIDNNLFESIVMLNNVCKNLEEIQKL